MSPVPPATDLVLRPAEPADLPRLVDIFVDAFQRGYPDVLPADVLAGVDVPTATEWFRRWSAADGLRTVVAQAAGRPVGFIRFGDDPAAGDSDPGYSGPGYSGPGYSGAGVGYVAALYVDPAASGKGIGRQLLEHAVAALAEQGRPVVRLWVFRANDRARGLYSSAGFVPDGAVLTDPQWRVPQIRLRREPAR